MYSPRTEFLTDIGLRYIAAWLAADGGRLCYLYQAVDGVTDQLASWLSDNTEKVFEEQPEIDDARGDLLDALQAVQESC